MSKISTLYVVPWYDCNLSCPHCNVKSKKGMKQHFNKVKEVLLTTDTEHTVLFGGEPTLLWDKFVDLISTGKIDSVSTNLVVYDSEFVNNTMVPIFKKYNLDVATSWNQTRFNREQFAQWLINVKTLCENEVNLVVMITMTKDLLEAPLKDTIEIFELIENCGVKAFLFEPFIGSVECNNEADEWLCRFHKAYKGKMENLLKGKLSNWNCDCTETYTIEPDGSMKAGCPDASVINMTFCDDCIKCENSTKCRPCILQKTCSYPKKYARLVEGEIYE